ncbi:MAG TPA: hypothetical protein VG710_11185 [Opitutus sp.]|nr:hypothetical protein [Opitutus sp.]
MQARYQATLRPEQENGQEAPRVASKQEFSPRGFAPSFPPSRPGLRGISTRPGAFAARLAINARFLPISGKRRSQARKKNGPPAACRNSEKNFMRFDAATYALRFRLAQRVR